MIETEIDPNKQSHKIVGVICLSDIREWYEDYFEDRYLIYVETNQKVEKIHVRRRPKEDRDDFLKLLDECPDLDSIRALSK
ncbi:hypothetical protein [Effusibacillus consociatus]|uniref:Uncharacterized protein n=1 Tax=Effusibacillus consociatus TaxID=1117041 RepID=A0ABV9PZZ5_9BACL